MHVLAVGMTGSGKTTLGKKLVKAYQSKGIKCAVLDPLCDPEWGADFQTDNQDEFIHTMYTSESCALFVDESGAAIGRYAGGMAVLATQSRHFGHKAHFFTQRGAQLDRTVRDQCSVLFIFRTGRGDAKTLAEEFGYDELERANTFRPGQAYKVTRFSPPELIDVFGNPLSD